MFVVSPIPIPVSGVAAPERRGGRVWVARFDVQTETDCSRTKSTLLRFACFPEEEACAVSPLFLSTFIFLFHDMRGVCVVALFVSMVCLEQIFGRRAGMISKIALYAGTPFSLRFGVEWSSGCVAEFDERK